MLIISTIEYIPDLNKRENNDEILEIYKKTYENTCSKKYGYIIKVLDIKQIIEKKISIYNGKVIVKCEILIDSLYPKVGLVINGNIQQIFPQGMIIIVKNIMKTFIPTKNKINFNIGDEITIKLEQIRFQKGKYDCIGIFKE